MFTVTALDAADTSPDRLDAVIADYLALEHARTYRQLLVTRFGALCAVLVGVGWGFHWLPLVGVWSTIAVCAGVPACGWIVERRWDRKLARSLDAPSAAAATATEPDVSRQSSRTARAAEMREHSGRRTESHAQSR